MLPFVVRPSGFPLSGINLESAAHSKKTCLTAGFFVVRPSGFEPLAYRVGVCHSIQLGYGYTLDTVHCSTLEQNEQYPKTNISN